MFAGIAVCITSLQIVGELPETPSKRITTVLWFVTHSETGFLVDAKGVKTPQ